jgi:isopenicillin N synthase-like dioxygenase
VTNGKADNHEGIDFYKPVESPDKKRPLWGENQWPTVPGFREKYEIWVAKMKMLGMVVMKACVIPTSFITGPLGRANPSST